MKVTALVVLGVVISMVMTAIAAAETGGTKADTTKAPSPEPKSKIEAKVSPKPTANPAVILETNMGTIKIELFKDKAPISVDNFVSYVKEGYFDGTIFHRVVKGFVIQAGGITEDMKQKPQKPGVFNEAKNGLLNLRGTLSMARTQDINSGSSHFFINLKDNAFLDHKGEDAKTYGYAVFGKVTEGMDVVDKIAQVDVATKAGFQDVPVKPVIITKATLFGAGPAKAAGIEKQPRAEVKPEDAKKPGEMKGEAKKIDEPDTKTTK
jgi:cyclophilin family peptidyl-prolyl cis-trans isomerase